MSQLTWQKSSFSEPGGDTCVEVALDRIGLRLRESVAPGTVATLAPSALVALVDWAKGEATSGG